jgi:hypothetical protein
MGRTCRSALARDWGVSDAITNTNTNTNTNTITDTAR